MANNHDMLLRENHDRELVHSLANRCQVLLLSGSVCGIDLLCRELNECAQGKRLLTVGGLFALLRILQKVAETIDERDQYIGLRIGDSISAPPKINQPIVHSALRAIEERAKDPKFTLAELGRRVGVSRFHIDRLLKRHTGESFTVHRRRARIKFSCELLRYSDLSIKQIAVEAGFEHVSSFDRAFKRECGCRPHDWKSSQT